MKNFDHVLQAIGEQPWAILPSTLATIVEVVRLHVAGRAPTSPEVQARLEAVTRGDRVGGRSSNKTAVIPIYGVIMPRANLMTEFSGGTSIQGLQRAFRAALADPEISTIVLDVDSPGGQAAGILEMCAEIYAARAIKPVIAVANYMAASAAYWLASQASELVVTPSGSVGSIGVVMVHEDWSKAEEMDGLKTTLVHAGRYKVEANPHEPLADDARAYMQSIVDEVYGQFLATVARGRGITSTQVRERFRAGRMAHAGEAVRLGMADRVGTLDDVISLRSGGSFRPAIRASAGRPDDELIVAKARSRLRAGLPGRDEAERLAIARLRSGPGASAKPPVAPAGDRSVDPALVLARAKARRNARARGRNDR